jgi:hypothetical protein
VRARLGVAVGALGVAAGLVARALRRQRRAEPLAPPDPRADQLRRKLEESRSIAEDRDEFQGAELPVDQVEALPDVSERRRAVHERARDAAERMRERGER